MKKYQNFLFDLDGTLIETEELIVRCFEYCLKKIYNIQVPEESLINKIGLPLKKQIELICQENQLKEIPFEDYQKMHMSHQLTIWTDYVKLFPGVEKVIQTLAQENKALGIVTSRKMPTTSLYLKHTKIHQFFKTIITPEKTQNHKPHAEPALKAMKELNSEKSTTIFVGDAIYDLKCGENAGIATYIVKWHNKKSVDYTATYTEKNLNKILDFI